MRFHKGGHNYSTEKWYRKHAELFKLVLEAQNLAKG